MLTRGWADRVIEHPARAARPLQTSSETTLVPAAARPAGEWAERASRGLPRARPSSRKRQAPQRRWAKRRPRFRREASFQHGEQGGSSHPTSANGFQSAAEGSTGWNSYGAL
jgi:hypothetical protein